jgi:hypothetical protein
MGMAAEKREAAHEAAQCAEAASTPARSAAALDGGRRAPGWAAAVRQIETQNPEPARRERRGVCRDNRRIAIAAQIFSVDYNYYRHKVLQRYLVQTDRRMAAAQAG